LWMGLSLAVALAVLISIGVVPIHLFSDPGPAWQSIRDILLPEYLENSALLGGMSFVLAILFGVSAAWLVSAYRFPGVRFFSVALFLPLAIPVYIMAYNYADIFGYGGLFETFQTGWLGIDQPRRPDVKNPMVLALLYALALFPYVFIPCRMIFSGRLVSYMEAGRSLKMTEASIFRKIMLPLAWPAAAAGGFLVLMEVWNDYGAAKYFGVNTLTTGIFHAWWLRADLISAVRLAAIMVFAVFALMWLEKRIRSSRQLTERSTGRTPERVRIPRWVSWLAFLWCGLLFFAGFGLVALNLVIRSVGVFHRTDWPNMGWAALNGSALALVGAMLIGCLALLVVFNHHLHRNVMSNMLMRWISVGYALPGAVLAVGVLVIGSWLGFKVFAVGTMALLIYAVVVRFFAVGVQQWVPAFERIPRSRDEAAISLGKSPGFTLFRLHLPLMVRHAAGVFILIFIDLLKELPLTLILKPFDFHTLATRTYELAENEMLARASVPALIIVLCGLIPLVFTSYLLKTRSK
jgi:iron(III) transport system permease protein